MSITAEVIDGTLKPDGTLELDHTPSLQPGRVKVALQTVSPSTPRRSIADVIDEIDRGQRARGFLGRTAEEIEASLREGEDEYEQKMREARLPSASAGDP